MVLIVLGDTVKINWLNQLSKKTDPMKMEWTTTLLTPNVLPFSQICTAFNTFYKPRQILSFTAFHGKVCNAVTLLM